ncbi:unnamed protein product [Cyclocybe aegerita]|uniref:Uncharacterized protein n=1 Tax=Cyclocybe aegerita TaxID=1973307 RepID=A0A8S0WMK0_CYCAE|nr:unnamed protein product [Cyclocybe aegerita]
MSPSQNMPRIRFHLTTVYLFIRSDIKTILCPVTLFAVASNPSTQPMRLVSCFFWVFMHLLLIDIDNQSMAVEEDRINKPWRPLPSRRISLARASLIASLLYPACALFSWALGGEVLGLTSVVFGVLAYLYDHLELNSLWYMKIVINSLGYATLETGASLVIGMGHSIHV